MIVEGIVRVKPVALRIHFEIGDLSEFGRLDEQLLFWSESGDEFDFALVQVELATVEVPVHVRVGPEYISTSHVERQNLTMRMKMRRFTRLTNAFSKKIDNHIWAIALHYMHYNFCWIHQSLRVTPAMEAGIADHAWSIEELVDLLDKTEIQDAA